MNQMLKQTIRALVQRPRFTLLIVLIMALCIGGNAAVFSAAKSVLVDSLPYPAPDRDRLVLLTWIYKPDGVTNDLAWTEIEDWKKRLTTVENLSGFLSWQSRILNDGETADHVQVNFASPGYFQLLGVKPQLGRFFQPEESSVPGSAAVAVLSDALWQRRYGADRDIVGRSILVNSVPFTVVGVLPPGFYDVNTRDRPIDVWFPAHMAGIAFTAGNSIFEARNTRFWLTLGRLKPGVSQEAAQREVEQIADQFAQEHPNSNREYTARVTPLRTWVFGDLFDGMKVVFAGALLVLLIGCGNVANLLLARQAERQDEFSLQLALGAGRGDLIRRTVLESLLLAGAGGALGLVFSIWGVKLLQSWVPLPAFAQLRLDGGVVLFGIGAILVTGLLFALPSVFGVLRLEKAGALQQHRASAAGRVHSTRTRSSLLVAQIAVVVVLLLMAGLLLRSFGRLRSTGVDFDSKNLLTMRVSFESQRFAERPALLSSLSELASRLQAVPGVGAVATWGALPPGISAQYVTLETEGAAPETPVTRSFFHSISPGALKVLGIPLLEGREFQFDDTEAAPTVTILTRSLAEALWPNQPALGKRLRRAARAGETWATVVGIIPDTRLHGRFTEGNFNILYPSIQRPSRQTVVVARTTGDITTMTEMLSKAIKSVDAEIPIYDIQSAEARLAREEINHRFNASIVALYAGLAVVFAVLGLYGLLSYLVSQRRKEIGVRMALGESRGSVMRRVMGRGIALVLVGLAIGVGGGLVVGRMLSTLLFDLTARDPLTFGTVILIFLAVALLATYLPARRVLALDPSRALRVD